MTRRSKAKDPNGPMTMCGMYINPFNHSVELMKEYLSKHKAMLFVKGQVIFPECISQDGIEPISVAKVYFENVLQQLKGHSPALAWGRNLSNNDKCIQYNFYLLLTEEKGGVGYYTAGLFEAYDELRLGLNSLNSKKEFTKRGLGVEIEQLYRVDDKDSLKWCNDWSREIYFADPTRTGSYSRSEFGFNQFEFKVSNEGAKE